MERLFTQYSVFSSRSYFCDTESLDGNEHSNIASLDEYASYRSIGIYHHSGLLVPTMSYI